MSCLVSRCLEFGESLLKIPFLPFASLHSVPFFNHFHLLVADETAYIENAAQPLHHKVFIVHCSTGYGAPV